MRGLIALALILCPAVASGQTETRQADRLETFWQAAVASPGPYVLALGGAVIDEFGNFPEEWTGGDGFVKRNFARLGSGFSSDVIGHSVGAILHHRVTYEPCGCSGGWSRTRHAFARGFVTRTDTGDIVPHVSLFTAKIGTAGLQNLWYPESYAGADIAREAIVGTAVNAALNVAREFGPELLQLVRIR